jgi:TetR/AcrR family transcriptional repressor of nem operon
MQVFWRHGYHGTSTQMLVEGMGVNRFSLYAEFGNKQALYEAALALYEAEVVERNIGVLDAPGANLDTIARLISGFAVWACQPGSELGCFICNTATERAPSHPDSRTFVNRYVERLSAGFTRCLMEAADLGQLQAQVDVLAEGRFLATLLLGIFVQLRAQVPAQVLQSCARAALSALQRLTVPGRWQPPSDLQVQLA